MTGRSSINGIVWTGLEKFLVYGINFVQGIVLARLLRPDDFGLTAMLGIFLAVGSALAETGFGTALVADGGKYACFESQAFRWNVGIATAIFAVLFVAAPFVADWYGIPVLAPLMRVMAIGLIINAASVVATARLTRELQFRKLAWMNSLPVLVGSMLAIGMAAMDFGVWSIVALGLASSSLRTLLAWRMAAGAGCGRQLEGGAGGSSECSFASFLLLSAKLTVSTLIYTIYSNLYQLVIGKLSSPATVGLFTRAQRWSRLPADFCTEPISRVVFADFSKGGGSFHRYLLLNCLLSWPMLACLWIFAEPIVGFVLGGQWLDCVPAMRILIVGAAFAPFQLSYHVLAASGRGNCILANEVVKRVLAFAALGTGCLFGLEGLCWSCVAIEVVSAISDFSFMLYVGRRK